VPRAPSRSSFLTAPTRAASVSGITPRFRGLPPCARQLPHVFLTRPPREPPEGDPVRLACIRHAASVDPEPGSNSPPSAYFSRHHPPVATGVAGWGSLFSASKVCLGPPDPVRVRAPPAPKGPRLPAPAPTRRSAPSSAHERSRPPATCQGAGFQTWNHPAIRGAITPMTRQFGRARVPGCFQSRLGSDPFHRARFRAPSRKFSELPTRCQGRSAHSCRSTSPDDVCPVSRALRQVYATRRLAVKADRTAALLTPLMPGRT
jgi:hypothetical protein